MYIGPLAVAFVLYEQIPKAILYRFEYTTPVLSLWYSRCSDMQRHRAILHLFEYTTPVLSLWYSRCSDMQRHRAILHLFEYTTPVLSLWYIWCSNMQQFKFSTRVSVSNGGFVLQMVVLLFQTGVWIISNWCLKIRLHFSDRLHIKALNLGFKV